MMQEHFATVVVEPNTLCREGLVSLLSTTRFRPTERLGTVEQIYELEFPREKDILFVADLGPHAEKAADGVRRLKAQFPTCCLLVLSDLYDPQHMWTVLRAGANGYLLKSMSSEALIKSLDLLALGEPVFPSAMLGNFGGGDAGAPTPEGDQTPLARPLSGREACVLRHLARGESNKIIARQLEITEATVKVHIKAILRKIQVKNRTQAAIWARDQEAAVEPGEPWPVVAGASSSEPGGPRAD